MSNVVKLNLSLSASEFSVLFSMSFGTCLYFSVGKLLMFSMDFRRICFSGQVFSMVLSFDILFLIQLMWLVSCRREGMLTQGPAPDPKCKLNISAFLTLPHLLDCLICTRNSMSIVLLLQMMGGWVRWGWLIYNRVWEGGQGVGIIL